jgi:hypothetical protein
MGAGSMQAVSYPDYPYCYRAKVLDNLDPEMLGRIKAQVYPMFATLLASELDWARPAFSLGAGAGDGFGSFSVPSIGTFVFVFFEAGDFRQPIYFAEAPTMTKGLPTERTVSYPDRKVWKTSSGISVQVDDLTHEIKISQPTGGASITLASDGKVTIESLTGVELKGGVSTPVGVVNGLCLCMFTGTPHADTSLTVKASK